jgi:pyruvate ferredoxin oxidoreductase beta subunit
MNTGIQKSGLTPPGARTTTTPAGNRARKKDMLAIVAAHGIPYAASASVGYIEDYVRKVQKAAGIRGMKFIHVLAPCPTGWGIGTDEAVEVAREAVDVGAWRLAEFEGGRWSTGRPPKDPGGIERYIKRQGRFRHLSGEALRAAAAGMAEGAPGRGAPTGGLAHGAPAGGQAHGAPAGGQAHGAPGGEAPAGGAANTK